MNSGDNMLLWNSETEIQFFTEALKNFASPEQLFYKLNSEYFAYSQRMLMEKVKHCNQEIH